MEAAVVVGVWLVGTHHTFLVNGLNRTLQLRGSGLGCLRGLEEQAEHLIVVAVDGCQVLAGGHFNAPALEEDVHDVFEPLPTRLVERGGPAVGQKHSVVVKQPAHNCGRVCVRGAGQRQNSIRRDRLGLNDARVRQEERGGSVVAASRRIPEGPRVLVGGVHQRAREQLLQHADAASRGCSQQGGLPRVARVDAGIGQEQPHHVRGAP